MPSKHELEALAMPIENDGLEAEVLEKHKKIICRNELVAGDDALAEAIVSNSKLFRRTKGDVLINHGDATDDVYFVLFGSARVSINSRSIDTRGAPKIIGEMAAMKPGEARSADVVIETDVFEARIMSAKDFGDLLRSYPSFHSRLIELVDNVGRKNLRLLGEKSQRPELSWTLKSAFAGIVTGVAGSLGTWVMGLEAYFYFLVCPMLAVAVFVGVLLLNPDLRYRNLSSSAGFALIAFVLYGLTSFVLTIDGQELNLPLIDFSVQTKLKGGIFAIGASALLLLTYFAGLLDLTLTKASEKK
ncbi:cyclic nucleotide-binding domain-containing protein [Aliiroseovarius crassostreae]|uniref:cyclic nucleotide-binding domain-containing protein n=1 Tax=Aliiroseovarius crassostreae TaxID=154981 RepID=UPI0021FDF0B8|nr:cyclic nucleotide-binding domain-containing protein [Aliiroseovarius crassostreae]UWQ00865.1 cyclic nucleotide-binding domain-containing protein [Aliiroseovarius crassostreae]